MIWPRKTLSAVYDPDLGRDYAPDLVCNGIMLIADNSKVHTGHAEAALQLLTLIRPSLASQCRLTSPEAIPRTIFARVCRDFSPRLPAPPSNGPTSLHSSSSSFSSDFASRRPENRPCIPCSKPEGRSASISGQAPDARKLALHSPEAANVRRIGWHRWIHNLKITFDRVSWGKLKILNCFLLTLGTNLTRRQTDR